jgi:hypothetical protein
MKYLRWFLLALLGTVGLAQSQAVYNYFPPPGVTYTATGGMALGSATACGVGCLNAQALEINGSPVGTGAGSVTSVSVVTANGFSGTVANATTTPAITLAPTFTGIGYSTGTGFQAAVAANFPTLNQNTTGNAATATLASTATALAATPSLCSSGQAAQGILANGNATGCITPYSVVNESANTFFAGPTSGTAALPSFRTMVAADLPLTSSPTWTGNFTMSPTSGVALAIDGTASSDAMDVTNGTSQVTKIVGSSTTGDSDGLDIIAGTNTSDAALTITNRSGSSTLFSVRGDGLVSVSGAATLAGTNTLSGATTISGTATLSNTTTLSGATTASGSFTLSGTTTASPGQAANGIGYQGLPVDSSTCSSGTCTLALSDTGKWVVVGTGGGTVTWPASTFGYGSVVTLRVCCSSSSTTITVGSGLTLYWVNGTEHTGNRTVLYGIVTLIQDSSGSVFITGSGIE